MKPVYKPSFIKDLKGLKSTVVFPQIHKLIFEDILAYESINQIPNLKKLKGEENAYRIRIRDYRIGIIIDKDRVVFERVLHRKEIYRYFP
jgi:mRNA interferase RelE/StbE